VVSIRKILPKRFARGDDDDASTYRTMRSEADATAEEHLRNNIMSGYSSVESAESLPVATPKMEMVEVEAPGTLSAGYTFQATYNGVVFPVTVVREVEKKGKPSYCIRVHILMFALYCSHRGESRRDRKLSSRLQIMKRRVSLRLWLPSILLRMDIRRMVCVIAASLEYVILLFGTHSFVLRFSWDRF